MKVQVTSVRQASNKLLDTPDKELYYLIVTNAKNEKTIINIGKKSHDNIDALIKNDKV